MAERPRAPRAQRAPSERRGLAAGAVILALLAGSALYAPLVANERPYVLTAVDRGAYRTAQRTLEPVIAAAVGLLERSADVAEAGRGAGGDEGSALRAERLAQELGAARLRLATLAEHLPDGDAGGAEPRALVDELVLAVERAREVEREGDARGMRAVAVELADLAARAREELVAAPPRAPPSSGGVRLVPSTRFPLLAALTPLDVGLMLAFALLAFHGVRALRGRGRPSVRALCAGLLLCALAGAAHGIARGTPSGLVGARVKAGLASGEIEAVRAWFPPIATGPSETKLAEAYRPPTWLPAGGRRWLAAHPGALRAEVLPGEPPIDAPRRHLLGTDGSGRDVASRLLWGGRVSLSVGFLSALCLTLLGTAIGSVAGWRGGLTDVVVSRAIDVVAAFPAFFLVLAAMAFLDRDAVSPVLGLVVVIALVNWTSVARLVRAELLRLAAADFVLALESLGFSRARILVRHVLPHALAPVWVAFAFAAAGGVLVESTISFLGFGVARPTASWGALIAESASPERWWLSIFPGLAILATVSSTHLVAQGLARALDPRASEGVLRAPAMIDGARVSGAGAGGVS